MPEHRLDCDLRVRQARSFAASLQAANQGASMIATLRRLFLVSAAAIALSASGLAQVSADLQKTLSQAFDAYLRADYAEAVRWYRLAADQGNA